MTDYLSEIWWDDSHDCSMATSCYKPFRRLTFQRQGGAALYIKEGMEYEELSLKNDHDQVKSLWVKVRDQSNRGSLVVGVDYKLQDVLLSQALVLLKDFNHTDICWKSRTVSCRQSRRLWNTSKIVP